jgi:hypothetical protein
MGAAPGAGERLDVGTETIVILENRHNMAGKHLANRRELQTADGPFEQGRADLLLEILDLPAHRRGGDIQGPGSRPD